MSSSLYFSRDFTSHELVFVSLNFYCGNSLSQISSEMFCCMSYFQQSSYVFENVEHYTWSLRFEILPEKC